MNKIIIKTKTPEQNAKELQLMIEGLTCPQCGHCSWGNHKDVKLTWRGWFDFFKCRKCGIEWKIKEKEWFKNEMEE